MAYTPEQRARQLVASGRGCRCHASHIEHIDWALTQHDDPAFRDLGLDMRLELMRMAAANGAETS